MARCEKCGNRVFLVDKTITHLEIDGEIVKELGNGDVHTRNCLRCTHPELYEDYKHLDVKGEKVGLEKPCNLRDLDWHISIAQRSFIGRKT
jgi:predicted nucleic-acid-binding Zn-ribbon protein